MGVALLFKALPFLWYFLKEFVVGKKRLGPANQNTRQKMPWRLVVMALFLVMVLFVNHTMDLNDKNEELQKQLTESAKAPKPVDEGVQILTRDHVELRLCQQQNQTNLNDLRIAEADKDRLDDDIQRLTTELAACKATPPQPVIPKVDKKNKKAAERLEKLEDIEGGSK